MAAFALICSYFLTAAMISAAIPTLQNPHLPATFQCTYPPAPQLKALECASAVLLLPDSYQNVDWHFTPQGIVIDTVLTTLDEPNSMMHLPRMHTMGNCRVKVEMQRGVHRARILWRDVRLHAVGLIRMCVGDDLLMPNPLGPGFGGTVGLGPLKITVDYGGGWPIPRPLMQATIDGLRLGTIDPMTNATS